MVGAHARGRARRARAPDGLLQGAGVQEGAQGLRLGPLRAPVPAAAPEFFSPRDVASAAYPRRRPRRRRNPPPRNNPRRYTGAAPLPEDTIRYLRSVDMPLLEVFGMSESCGAIAVCGPLDGGRPAGACGAPLPRGALEIGPDGEVLWAGPRRRAGIERRSRARGTPGPLCCRPRDAGRPRATPGPPCCRPRDAGTAAALPPPKMPGPPRRRPARRPGRAALRDTGAAAPHGTPGPRRLRLARRRGRGAAATKRRRRERHARL